MTESSSLAQRFSALADPALWRGIAPTLNIGSVEMDSAATTPLSFDAERLAALKADLTREGYFRLPDIDWGIDFARVAAGVSAVVAAGHMPVFAFMYDEPWYFYARLRSLFAAMLDDGYKMMPAFWAWHVDGTREPAGWSPHRDLGYRSLMFDRRPKAMTFWMALSDATPDNGCMYVLPADRDKFYGTVRDQESPLELQDVRALPSPAGGLLGWTQAIFHWGGRARRPVASPRISISMEFQRGDQAPIFEPLLDPAQPLDMTMRLRLILRQLLQYKHMYPLAPELESLAEASGFRPGPTPEFLQSMMAK